MKLGYLVPEFPSQTHAFFWREAQSLEADGYGIVHLSTRRPPDDACRHPFAEKARARTRYLFPPRMAGAALHLATRPIRALRALAYVLGLSETPLAKRARLLGLLPVAAELVRVAAAEGVDHVHVHSCANAAHIAAIARLLGGPTYSLTLHGDLEVYGTDHAAKARRALFVAPVTRPLQKALVETLGLPVERAPVVWMGVDTERFAPRSRPERRANSLHIATVARLNASKGHEHVLRVLRRLLDRGLDVRYTIAGDGPHRAAIEAEIGRLDLASAVTLAGSIGEDAVLELLHATDAFVLASVGLGEAAPVSVMEAMACGVPVVCSIIGGTRDMLTDGVDGLLVEQADEEGLFTALERLAREPATAKGLAAAARSRALEAFDHRRMARRLAEEIERARGAIANDLP